MSGTELAYGVGQEEAWHRVSCYHPTGCLRAIIPLVLTGIQVRVQAEIGYAASSCYGVCGTELGHVIGTELVHVIGAGDASGGGGTAQT
eukprot:2545304-Rhodomonas_salina.1